MYTYNTVLFPADAYNPGCPQFGDVKLEEGPACSGTELLLWSPWPQGWLLAEKILPYLQAYHTIDSNFGGSVHACSLFHTSPYTRACCSHLVMMGRRTRPHCQTKDTQYLTIKSSWPKWLVLGYSTCRYFVMR